jgi:uncharacterized protein YndB with AHSA1/START domain
MSRTTTDRIEREIHLRATRSRVWRALTDSKEFGTWFGMEFTGQFQPGARLWGRITHPGYEHLKGELAIEAMEPERYFAYRWHPNAVDPDMDYSQEPMTLVEFTLEDAEGGTRLRLAESGFDAIPIARRAEALRSNEGGWAIQMAAIDDYLRRNS